MKHLGETLSCRGQAKAAASACGFQTEQFRSYGPAVVAIAASVLALCPIQGAQANPTDAATELETADQVMINPAESDEEVGQRARYADTPTLASDTSQPHPLSLTQIAPPESLMPESLMTLASEDASSSPIGYGTTAFPGLETSQLGEQVIDSPAVPLEDSLKSTPDIPLEVAQEASPDEAVEPEPEPALELEESPEATSDDNAQVFGRRGDRRWYAQIGGATTPDNDKARRFGMLGAGISHFFANGQSINLELNGMAFNQTGDDAVGLNLALLHRWHFVRQPNWSLYIDGGVGILGTTNDVPAAGSSFNFTPQAGGGATIRLNDEERLMVGLRWHHISNADIYDSNPGRDSVLGYVGVNFPR